MLWSIFHRDFVAMDKIELVRTEVEAATADAAFIMFNEHCRLRKESGDMFAPFPCPDIKNVKPLKILTKEKVGKRF